MLIYYAIQIVCEANGGYLKMAKKTRKFKTEVQQLLDLVINSLYSKKEIFLRELISNASDAIDRARFEALTDEAILEGDSDWKIKIIPDKKARTLTIVDNGIGMSAEEVESNIGTIANSGTKNFLENIQSGSDPASADFIGQFGVGFYASFMVADKVSLVTKRAGAESIPVRWESKGAGDYTLDEADKPTRGTEIVLHLREGMDEYLDEWRIRSIVKEYSDYIAFPVVMDVKKTQKAEKEGEKDIETIEEETLNSMKSLWKKQKHEIKDEEYNEFYKHISRDFSNPLKVIHYHGEGTTEFKALLYIPSQAPMDLFWREGRRGVQLYVKNVFITDNCEELLPEYLRFVKGVVDSSDLPLNVSREMLQDDIVIKRIRKNIVGKVLAALAEIKEKDLDKYYSFTKNFGSVLKEGLAIDFENRDKIKELIMFPSTRTPKDKPTSLAEYVQRMPEGQKDIYFISGESYDTVANSPHLEVFRKKGFEVLYFTELVDEWVMPNLTEYKDKKLTAIHRGDIELDSEEEKKEKEAKREESDKKYQPLLKLILKKLESDVSDVRLSNRLTDSVSCLVDDDKGPGAGMERIMKAMNQAVPENKRILEINPDHPVTEKLNGMFEADQDNPRLGDYIELLIEQARLAEGTPPKNPHRFTKLVSDLMLGAS